MDFRDGLSHYISMRLRNHANRRPSVARPVQRPKSRRTKLVSHYSTEG